MGKQKLHLERLYRNIGKPQAGALAAGYVRSSSDMQDPATIVTQKRRIQEFAESNGWHIVRWFEEPEISAKFEEIEKRPVFAELLAQAGRDFQIVLCYMNDRWARNTAVAYMSLDTLRNKRVWWATADGLWDIDKAQQDGSDVAFAIDTQLNAAFIRRLSQRAIDAKEDRARDGYHNGSVPFGYLPPEYPKAPDGAPSTWKPPRMPVRRDPVNFPALVRLGELAAQGWADAAIADELVGHVSTTPRFGQRLLSKDTVAAMRRMWFPREFAPGCGHGTIETPSGELVEGRHPAAWPYELWQQMVGAKSKLYRRPRAESQRQAHEFSRMVVCAGCHRPLRVQNYPGGKVYYRDTSALRKLPCATPGYLSVTNEVISEQFGALLASVHLPVSWRQSITDYCITVSRIDDQEPIRKRRTELEKEQERLVLAFAKGYLTEDALDTQMETVRSELFALPVLTTHNLDTDVHLAVSAGETLVEMAEYWPKGAPMERRDILWALLMSEGLIYDLERWAIVAVIPRRDVLPALALGLDPKLWQQRSGGLWLREQCIPPKRSRPEFKHPPLPECKLNGEQAAAALKLVRSGKTLREVGKLFGVSYSAIWRLMQAERGKTKQVGETT
ncbi:MAG: recombinase family protein [Ktedonobacterales bacterium]